MAADDKLCVACGKPVTVSARDYEVFEQRHWLCFHLEFEHDGDPDACCADPSCPWWHIEVLLARLTEIGEDPRDVLARAIRQRWGASTGDDATS